MSNYSNLGTINSIWDIPVRGIFIMFWLGLYSCKFSHILYFFLTNMYLTGSLLLMYWQRLQIKSYSWLSKPVFPHTLAESKLFLPLVFTKMLLSPKDVRKNSILASGGNKECLKSQVYCPRLHLGHQFTCDFEHSLFFLPWWIIYYYAKKNFFLIPQRKVNFSSGGSLQKCYFPQIVWGKVLYWPRE